MKKKANKKGFTIMEMLIVVAIIAVLVAIAIPTFNGALTKAKEATDVANIRAAYAEVMVANMTNAEQYPTKDDFITKTGGLNYADKLTYSPETAGNEQHTITYKAKALKNKDGGDTFSWTLKSGEIN